MCEALGSMGGVPKRKLGVQQRQVDNILGVVTRWRHLIENFFAKLKQYRGIATLYDQRDCAFLGDTQNRVAAVI